MAAGFIFGGEGLPKTPQELARLRAVAAAMQPKRAPRDVGEGIYALGSGLASGLTALHANRQEQKGQEGAANAFQSIVSAMNGGGGGSSAPSISNEPSTQFSYSGSIPAAETETDPANRRIDQGFAAFGNQDDVGKRLMGDLMGDFSLSKEQAAGVVGNLAHESGGFESLQEIKPLVPGSRGGYGYAQWTGPRRRAYEAYAKENQLDPSSYEANYGFLKHELQNTPEGRVLNGLKNAQTAGEAAEMFSKGFLRPGIPYMDSRIQRANEYQTASLGPVVGPEQPAADPKAVLAQRLMAARGQSLPESQPPAAQQAQAMQGGNVQPQPSQGIQRVAQAAQGMDQQSMKLIEAMNNPYMSQGQKAVLGAMLEQRMQSSDPMRQMQLEKAQLELEQMRNPSRNPVTVGQGQTLVDPRTGEVIFQGQQKQAELPGSVREYEYAKQQGFPGSFQDWEASKKGGMSLQVDPATGQVTFQQGGNMKPLTEGQSKDAVYSTRAEGALLTLDQYEQALTGLGDTVAGGVPLVGNMIKSPEFQQAEQAGTEFLQAVLRKDTGAAITAQEQEEYGKVYLPRPGDTPETIAQKKKSRIRALEAMKAGMPPQAILAQEKALEKTGDTPYSSQQKEGAPQGEVDTSGAINADRAAIERGSASGVGGDFMTRLPNMTREDLQGLDRSKMSLEELKAAAERYRMLVGGEI
jgi:hypothetical protein